MKMIGKNQHEFIKSLIKIIEPSEEEAREIADKIHLCGIRSFFANLESFTFSNETWVKLKALKNILDVHDGFKGDNYV